MYIRKMSKFIYLNNKEKPPQVIFETICEDILHADKKFEEATKLNPEKCPWIGCRILPEVDKK